MMFVEQTLQILYSHAITSKQDLAIDPHDDHVEVPADSDVDADRDGVSSTLPT
jgi:hypothetical protein